MTTIVSQEAGGGRKYMTHEQATAAYNLDPKRNLKLTKTTVLALEDPANAAAEAKGKQEDMRKYFHSTYEIFDKIFSPLVDDDVYVFPPLHKLRHPLMFYLGHTAVVYMNKLVLAGLTTRINPVFEEQFATGVDEMSWDDLNEVHYSWPPAQDVWEYRRQVRDRIDELFQKYTLPLPLTFDTSTDDNNHAFFWGMMLGIEHERIHLETASVHIRELPIAMVKPDAFWKHNEEAGEAPADNEMIEFGGQDVLVGRQADDKVYGHDSDFSDKLTIAVKPFKASLYLVSNKEYLAFMEDGGYSTRKYWDEEGWGWLQFRKVTHPTFWVPTNTSADPAKQYLLRVQTEEIEMPWNWPCETNNLEAHAFCQWKAEKTGKKLRLPTEAEWLVMRDECVPQDQWEWEVAPGNINLEHGMSSCPVNKFKQGKLYDVVGNVWQHTETPVYPYPGFKPHPFYDDFSLPTFDGKHRCQKGGAWVSTGNEATRDSRFAFRRHFYQMIGIRYIEGEDVDEMAHMGAVLGLDGVTDLAAQRSFTEPTLEGVAHPQIQLAELADAAFEKHSKLEKTRILNLCCGAGRTCFELTKTWPEVMGSDFTARVLQPAYAMIERGIAAFSVVDGKGEREQVVALGKDYPAWNKTREHAKFYQSDPANLHAHMTAFDMVVAFDINAKVTSYNPASVAPHLVSRAKVGGLVMFVEPATNPVIPVASLLASIEGKCEVVADPSTVDLFVAQIDQKESAVLPFSVVIVRKL